MTLRLRIFLFNLVTVTTAFALIALVGYKVLEKTIVENTYEKLNLIRVEKTKNIENYFRDLITGTDLIATNNYTIQLLSQTNPQYKDTHLSHIDEYARSFNLLDLFLIDTQGRIAYTTNKNHKLGVALNSNDKKLFDLYLWGKNATKGSYLLLDFDYEEDSSSEAISYLTSPVYLNEKKIGTLVFRISINQIDQITSDNYTWQQHGLGTTGETLIYGEDWSLRNTSRFSIEHSENYKIKTNPSIFATNRGNEDFNKLNEFDELQERGTDYRSVPVIRTLGKLYLPNGDNWYIQVKMDESEAFLVLKKLVIASATAAFIIIVVFFLLSYAATRQVIQPILLLIERLEILGTENLSQKINYRSKDEIGTLVSKYNQLADRLEKTTVSKEFVDSVIASLREYLFIVRIDRSRANKELPYVIIQANDSALEALATTAYDIHNKDLRDIIDTVSNFRDHTWLLNNRHSIEADLKTNFNKKIPVLVNWSLLPVQKSNDLIFVFACTDMTEMRANEIALIKAREDAISASMAKSEFLARMSHEIRTPLNALLGMNEVLKDSGLNAEQQTILQISSNAGENLMAIISDVLDLSKIDAKQITFESIPFNLYELSLNVCEIFKQKAKDKNLNLQSEILISPTTIVIGDPTRLRQILFNLISNAIKFTDEGSILLKVEQSGKKFNFIVKDSGPGIEKNKHDLIFKNFSQADSSITRKYGGTGLGLAICKNLVELMGGHIAFESDLGVGSTFYFQIPLPIETEKQLLSTKQSQASTMITLKLNKKIKILIVDDTEDNRYLMRAYLQKQNCVLSEANNGMEAVELIKTENFDLIFMDVQMPVMDGYEAARKIRQIEKNMQNRTSAIIVTLSANAMTEDMQNSIDAGCNDYVSKPIKKDIIYKILEKYFHEV